MPSLPQSFLKAGFGPPPTRKFRRLLIGTEGEASSGKTEFIASAPGPGIVACIDRNYEAMLENPKPPKARHEDFAYRIINIPLDTQGGKDDYIKAWRNFKDIIYSALSIPEALTVGIDTDNASWELQQLAEFGRLVQIPPIMRTGVNTARRAFIARLSDSGKNIIATNMLKDEWRTLVDEEGNPVQKDGKEVQEKTGYRKRQGFGDQNYLWQVQLRHLVKPPEMVLTGAKEVKMPNGKVLKVGGRLDKRPTQFGIRILKCTRNSELVDTYLWGDQCNFAGLVKCIYPEYPLTDWGF